MKKEVRKIMFFSSHFFSDFEKKNDSNYFNWNNFLFDCKVEFTNLASKGAAGAGRIGYINTHTHTHTHTADEGYVGKGTGENSTTREFSFYKILQQPNLQSSERLAPVDIIGGQLTTPSNDAIMLYRWV